MTIQITIDHQIASIIHHEFPVDDSIRLSVSSDEYSWQSKDLSTPFHLLDSQGNISKEVFSAYSKLIKKQTLTHSNNKVLKFLNRKEEGLKIIPGHGVFILPSNMVVKTLNPSKPRIQVFQNTEYSKSFCHPDMQSMVDEASAYYFQHFNSIKDEINESLYRAVRYDCVDTLYQGIPVPTGVLVYSRTQGRSFEVRYANPIERRTMYFGSAKNLIDLEKLIKRAHEYRQSIFQEKAVSQLVTPTYMRISEYMKQL